MKNKNYTDSFSYTLLTLSTLFWGGNFIIGKLMILNMSPIILTQIR